MDVNIGYKVVWEKKGNWYSYSTCLVEGERNFDLLPLTRYRMLRVTRPIIPNSPIFAFSSFGTAREFLGLHRDNAYSDSDLIILKGLVSEEKPEFVKKFVKNGILASLCYSEDWWELKSFWGEDFYPNKYHAAISSRSLPPGTILVDYFFPLEVML